MKNPDLWFEKARRDYEIAYKLLEDQNYPYIPEALYHAQQSVEKSLKGFLVFHGIRPDRTHNLVVLLDACMLINPKFNILMQHARDLTDFAIKTRYPEDDFMIPFLATAQKYTADAKFVFNFIQNIIQK
jgi:HEPN domain-containing protein